MVLEFLDLAVFQPEVFQILPIKQVFIVVVQRVNIGIKDIFIGAPKVVKLPQCIF